MRLLRLIAFYLILIGISACTSDSAVDVSKFVAKPPDILEIAVQIDDIVGDAEARFEFECKSIPIGAKPCGGPWAHLVYSTSTTNTIQLRDLIDLYTELDHIRNEEEGRGSTCDISGIPELKLKDGKCYGDGPYAWNPGDILKFNGIEND